MFQPQARTVSRVPRRNFRQQSETFGFDTATPWALPALRLLFCVPRAYEPLVHAWELRHPGTLKALERLTDAGFVQYQPAVIIDTRTGAAVTSCGPPLERYLLTASGRRLLRSAQEDLRVLEDSFPRLSPGSAPRLLAMLDAMNLESPYSRLGVSVPTAATQADLPDRSARWWTARLVTDGLVRRLPEKLADAREVIPAHWRVTRVLTKQLLDVITAFPASAPPSLRVELRLGRSRFLDDIDPARVGLTGATDYDHDVQCQRVLAALVSSPRSAPQTVFSVEPRLNLPVDQSVSPWRFDATATDSVFYQPDAEMRERTDAPRVVRRSVVEYERFQTRRDAWNHIERFLGWLHTMTMPFEPAVLRFVVDSEPRVRSYVELIEAFADYCLDHPERLPRNPVLLAVASVDSVCRNDRTTDPLDDRVWYRITLPAGSDHDRTPVLHDVEHSPYEEYFG